MEFGLASALSAGVKRDRILNFMAVEELLDWVGSLRKRSTRRPAA
jgi:hypothetical protein